MNQARNKTTGNTGPYCELYCHAVCTWKLWNLPLSWSVYARIRLNLINPRVLKVERGLHVKMLDSAPFTIRPWKNAFCLISFKKSLPFRKYAIKLNLSFGVTLNYLMQEVMEFCVTSSLALDNWETTLGNKPNHSHCVHAVRAVIFQREHLNYLIVCFTQCTLFFQKFVLYCLFPCVICGSYVTKINAVLWHSARQTFASLGLFLIARIACLLQLWIKPSELDYSFWATPKQKALSMLHNEISFLFFSR